MGYTENVHSRIILTELYFSTVVCRVDKATYFDDYSYVQELKAAITFSKTFLSYFVSEMKFWLYSAYVHGGAILW